MTAPERAIGSKERRLPQAVALAGCLIRRSTGLKCAHGITDEATND